MPNILHPPASSVPSTPCPPILPLQAVSAPVSQTIPPFAAVFTFIAYVASGNTLDPATAFTVMSLFMIVRMPFVILPMTIPLIAECLIALKRFSAFFELATHEVPVPSLLPVLHEVPVPSWLCLPACPSSGMLCGDP